MRRPAVAVIMAALVAGGTATPPAHDRSVASGPLRLQAASDDGAWSEPFDMGGVAIHATLMRNGEILFFQYVEGDPSHDHTSFAGTWDYRTGATVEAPIPYDRDVFCAGNNVLPDGRVFISGGHDHTTGHTTDPVGVAETDTYNPMTRAWKPGPLLTQKRWYPTNVGLGNGRTLVFGGHARVGTTSNTVDLYTPSTNSVTRLPATANKSVGLYPRMHLMPNGKVLKVGQARMSAYFDPATSRWSDVAAMRYGTRRFGTSVLLPGARRVLTFGGQTAGSVPPTRTAEVLDAGGATPRWHSTESLTHPRLHANAVVLPDDTVLAVGGGKTGLYGDPVKVPELYDPATGHWTAMAPQRGGRAYHSTAVLLPDARVLSAGQNQGPLAEYGEIFSPPYLFRGARPRIEQSPAAIGYGQPMTVATADAARIAKVRLIRAGSATHGVDMEQRSLPLAFTAGPDSITAKVPTNRNLAPPGYYLLFIVDRDGVPSVASWVRLR